MIMAELQSQTLGNVCCDLLPYYTDNTHLYSWVFSCLSPGTINEDPLNPKGSRSLEWMDTSKSALMKAAQSRRVTNWNMDRMKQININPFQVWKYVSFSSFIYTKWMTWTELCYKTSTSLVNLVYPCIVSDLNHFCKGNILLIRQWSRKTLRH